jgi:aminocyclitol acetyltransferase
MIVNRIGRFCSINKTAAIGGNHPMNMVTTFGIQNLINENAKNLMLQETDNFNSKGTNEVIIGSDVWIGAQTFINASKCSKIGDGAIIGTGSVVMNDVPPYAIVYGTPAKVQRYRFTLEEIEILLRVKWWNWDDETIREKGELLIYPKKFFEYFKSI